MSPLVIGQLDAIDLSRAEILDAWIEFLPIALGIVIYLLFIFEFYRFVARRDVFTLRLRRYAHGPLSRGIEAIGNFLRVVFYLLEYIVIYPVLIIIWYLAFVVFLAFLAIDLRIETLLLIAIAIVTAIRITAYYSEDLSRDLAKMLPLALLGALILDGATAVSLSETLQLVLQVPTHWRRILTYLLLLIPLEFTLRIARIVITRQLTTIPEPSQPVSEFTFGDDGTDRNEPEP